MIGARWWAAVLLAAPLACGAPPLETDAAGGQSAAGADTTGGGADSGNPGGSGGPGPQDGGGHTGTDVFTPTPGAPCPAGPLQCPQGLGCQGGVCGTCGDASDCLERDGCAAGVCGPCTADAHCRPGEVCRTGTCLAPVPTWDLVIAPADFDQLVENETKEDWYACSLRVGAETYSGGQVRLRGGSSLSSPKRSFRIEFDKGKGHPGYTRKINLRAEWNDPTYLRNALTADTFRHLTTLPTFRTRFVWLTVNGEPYGLMSEVERVGSAFVEQRGLPEHTPVYDADAPHELATKGCTQLLPLPGMADYEACYDKQNGEGGHGDLAAFVEGLWADYEASPGLTKTSTGHVRETADIARIVDYLAVMAAMHAHDHVRKNFVMARLPTGDGARWTFVPWDLDLTWGCLYDVDHDDTICDTLVVDEWYDAGTMREGMDDTYPTSSYFNLLIHLVVNDPELRSRLQERICAVFASDWWRTRLPGRIGALRDHLYDLVQQDERDLNDDADAFIDATKELETFLTARPEFLGQYIGCPQ